MMYTYGTVNSIVVEIQPNSTMFTKMPLINNKLEPRHEFSNDICAISKGSDKPTQRRSLFRAFASRLMCVKLLTEQHLEFLSLIGDCTGSSESTHVKIPHCWKSHAAAHI